ncbi:MAG TPA: hypothetical protein VMR98_01170 [Candidatus Polarisedimenticolaceae bacterium]|nr:hypothetical protein [Candidatus Polarisedimenticolaceae bacterium]
MAGDTLEEERSSEFSGAEVAGELDPVGQAKENKARDDALADMIGDSYFHDARGQLEGRREQNDAKGKELVDRHQDVLEEEAREDMKADFEGRP